MQMGITKDHKVSEIKTAQVFDRNALTIIAPPAKVAYSIYDFLKKPFRAYQVQQLRKLLCKFNRGRNFKSILVLGPSANEEADELHKILSVDPSKIQHIHAKNEYLSFEAFKNTPDAQAVIYGGKTHSTGLNLPERFGAVVITRPPNGAYSLTQEQYHILREKLNDYWELYHYRRDQLALQAAGRLQRSPGDTGIILILGETLEPKKSMRISEVIHKAWEQDSHKLPIRVDDWQTYNAI